MKRARGVLLAVLLACSERQAPTSKPISSDAGPTGPAPSAPPASNRSSRADASPAIADPSSSCGAPRQNSPRPLPPLTLIHAPLAPSALASRAGLWLADEQYALVSATPSRAWADGAATYTGHDSALRNVVLKRIPQSLRSWLGRPVRILGASGAVCDTRLQRFLLRAEVNPDPARAEVWEGCSETPHPPALIAEEIWRLAKPSGLTLVAELATPCKGALLAVDPDLPAPTMRAPQPASAELGERAFAAFRALAGYAVLQARYRSQKPNAEGAWDDHDARRSAWSLALPGHALVFVSVEAGARCDFSGSLSALWEADGPALTLLIAPEALDAHRLTPVAILDLDGSGEPSVLLGPDGNFSARALLTKHAQPSYGYHLLSSIPFFVDPC